MYEVIFYKTDSGNEPFDKLVHGLLKEHKTVELAGIWLYIDNLKKYGREINKFVPGSIKHLKNKLWELRPQKSRILFFYFDKRNCFVILHGFIKKTQKTPKKEIERGEQEIKNIEGRQWDEGI
jgi:phage-related protein